MSGHSKWATIKRKKGAEDARRGKVFTKFIRELTVAARQGGGDPNGNPRLRTVIDKAKQANMPQDNIARAIKKGTGELEGAAIEEHVYEGYGPGGAAIILEIITDNRNRTISEIRNILGKNGGNLGEAGCVGWIFKKKGVMQCDKGSVQEDQLMEIALDAGAEDIRDEEDVWSVVSEPENFEKVKKALADKKIASLSAEVTMIPENTVQLTGGNAERMLRLVEALEDHDDVQNVYSNFDIPKEEMERISRLVV
ncbi:MAG: YebC/PmpR family DNA-binding transcriptional regulator [Deltaproteobacteria bacterium]|nr:YebC/PmpR family DNA-binding transcriptional regulator [Deltaproteobacteria bacterium]